jgi:hypothetical protein
MRPRGDLDAEEKKISSPYWVSNSGSLVFPTRSLVTVPTELLRLSLQAEVIMNPVQVSF